MADSSDNPNEHEPADDASAGNDVDSIGDENGMPSSSALPMLVGIATALILGVGAVGWLSGAGWFSYRTILYDGGQLYAINLGTSARQVSVDGRAPRDVPPDGKNYFDLIGGTSQVRISDPDGEVLKSLAVTVDGSDALVKVSEKGCLAAVDVSYLYNPNVSAPDRLPIAARIDQQQRLYIPETNHVVWPREQIPTKLTGADSSTPRAVWIETCGCQLLEPGNEHMLDTYLSVQLQARMERSTRSRPAN